MGMERIVPGGHQKRVTMEIQAGGAALRLCTKPHQSGLCQVFIMPVPTLWSRWGIKRPPQKASISAVPGPAYLMNGS